jgi:Glycosyltransferase family 87
MRGTAVALVAVALLATASPASAADRVTRKDAQTAFLRDHKVAGWLSRYPQRGRIVDTTWDSRNRAWRVDVWWGEAGEIATGRVSADGRVVEAWTGPQVAWKMARGGEGGFGGKTAHSLPVWLGFSLAFLLGLADLRRPRAVRNLDLVVLLSFSASLWFFQHGDIFTSVPLVYPPLVYLLARALWVAVRNRPPAGRPLWPAWVLVAAAVFLAGFRIGLNVQASSVIDVGYSGVVGADRIAHGQAPYGHFPVEDARRACGPADNEGEIRERIQTNGRCESADPQGDTYGPVTYFAYLPGYWLFGWTGKWDDLPAAHFTAIAFDLLTLLGLALVGRRYGGDRLAATLAFAWTAFPFTQYVSNSNSNDAIAPALLVWGFWLAGSPWARGAFGALAAWTKFFSLAVVPLWLAYPRRTRRGHAAFAAGFVLATLAAFSVLLLEPNPLHAARVFWDRTLGWQIDRPSPFSLWDWGQYRAAGIPDLHLVRRGLEVVVALGLAAMYFMPRRTSPLQLAALTAAAVLGVQLVITHWFYLYIVWFFPFLAVALFSERRPVRAQVPDEVGDRPARELAAVG